jgi:hypothetical protein
VCASVACGRLLCVARVAAEQGGGLHGANDLPPPVDMQSEKSRLLRVPSCMAYTTICCVRVWLAVALSLVLLLQAPTAEAPVPAAAAAVPAEVPAAAAAAAEAAAPAAVAKEQA